MMSKDEKAMEWARHCQMTRVVILVGRWENVFNSQLEVPLISFDYCSASLLFAFRPRLLLDFNVLSAFWGGDPNNMKNQS